MYNLYEVIDLKYNIKLVHQEHLQNEYYEFDFEKPSDFHFQEGQYGIFEITHKEIDDRKSRVFSIASSDDDSYIRIATKIPKFPSIYKQTLLSMKPGEEMSLTGPIGKFTLEDAYKAVYIAGGIGITPIRSILMSKKAKSRKHNDLLIYSELEKSYPYIKELEQISNLEIQCVADVLPTIKSIKEAAEKYHNDASYYVSGGPAFVKDISALLQESGVKSNNIKFDVFVGY